MHTETYCLTLDKLDPVKAIRAIHQAHLQLAALNQNVDCEYFDNVPALAALGDCLADAGHIGYQHTPERDAFMAHSELERAVIALES